MGKQTGYYRRQMLGSPDFDALYVELGDWVVGYLCGENDADRSEVSGEAFGRLTFMRSLTHREDIYTPAEIAQRIA